ncbi:MAG: response regulator [Candidatus Sulfotelmatobacter sp.]|jgi:two-component system, OmpR family, KDP operon response regulator KdpE
MGSKKTILIVDDDPDIRLGYQVLLTAHHYDTLFACDAFSTLTEAATHKPDLIILDLGLPALPRLERTMLQPESGGGFLVMERLAADTNLALIPVVVVSGLDPNANRGRAIRAGAMAFVQKPWDQDKLLAIIGELVGSPERPISQPQ